MTKEASISHELLSNEIFGKDLTVGRTTSGPDTEEFGITGDLRWMIFKVKQKGENNYYKTTVRSQDDQNFKFTQGKNPRIQLTPTYSYNWPYDYFSLVELIKLDADITWGNEEQEGKEPVEEKYPEMPKPNPKIPKANPKRPTVKGQGPARPAAARSASRQRANVRATDNDVGARVRNALTTNRHRGTE